MVLGHVIDEEDTISALAITSSKLKLGTYTILEYDGYRVLGLITKVSRGSPLLNGSIRDPDAAERISNMRSNSSLKFPEYTTVRVKLLCNLNDPDLLQPDLPPPPGTPLREPTDDELSQVFSNGDLRLGKLVGSDTEVRIRLRYLTRHLAILAATGSGKSNTVAVLSQRISELGGAVVIFDYHGEYSTSTMKNINPIQPKLNPLRLTAREFATFINIRENAFVQYRILRSIWNSFKESLEKEKKEGEMKLPSSAQEFVERLKSLVETQSESGKKGSKDTVAEVLNKLEDFADTYSSIVDFNAKDVVDQLKLGQVNVVDLINLDEEAMEALVSHYLRRILENGKLTKSAKLRGESHNFFPVVVVLEEAHVFLPRGGSTLVKFWASKVAREGRKFGVSLVIVSQRPKGLDDNILSQMTNKIVLKIVEPTDKRYILESSDNLSEDLVEQLSSLNTGQAIVVGKIVSIPAILQVDKFDGILGGSDPDILGDWRRAREERESTLQVGRRISQIGDL